jgi:hypothetical protein
VRKAAINRKEMLVIKLAASALALAAAVAPAVAADGGPYGQVALGQTRYYADCSFFGCGNGRVAGGKLGVGYRFDVFALEGWYIDWGSTSINDYYGDDRLRLRSLGVGAAWRMQFGTSVQGVLRAGAATVSQRRTTESFHHLEGTFGLGLSYDLTPNAAIELAHDLTTSSGGSSQIGSVLAQLTSLGLRLRF